MATSVWIYESEKDYRIIYPRDTVNSIEMHNGINDIYVKDGQKLWISTTYKHIKDPPRLARSLVHFHENDIGKYLEGDEILVKHGNIKYVPKTNKLEIGLDNFKKLNWQVDRYVGKVLDKGLITTKKYDIDYDQRYYDLTRNKISFILKEIK